MLQPSFTNVYRLPGPHSQYQKVPKGTSPRLLVILVLAGSLRLRADGSDFCIGKHDFIAVHAGQQYDVQDSGYKAILVDAPYTGFSSDRLAMLAMLLGRTIPLRHEGLAIMYRLMEIASLCAREERSGRSEAFLSGILDLAISLAFDSTSPGYKNAHAPGPASAFLLLAGKSIRRHHSVAYYADALNITPTHLNRTVKAMLGLTAKSCLESMLISQARLLLEDPGLNIAEISDILHFTHPAVFSRFFSRLTGNTPRRYRVGV